MLRAGWEGLLWKRRVLTSLGGHRGAGPALPVEECGPLLHDPAKIGPGVVAGPRPKARVGELPPASQTPEGIRS